MIIGCIGWNKNVVKYCLSEINIREIYLKK